MVAKSYMKMIPYALHPINLDFNIWINVVFSHFFRRFIHAFAPVVMNG